MLPSGYLESRKRFTELAAGIGAELHTYVLSGHEPLLSTDVAYLGPKNAATLIVIASGTHGVEGYAGAACQLHFLQTYSTRFAGDGIGYLLVHAVNPWGFFHDRRVTAEGVDLNRNFVGFPVREPDPAGYRNYHGLLVSNYRPLPGGWWNEARLLAGAMTRGRRAALQAAVTAGQYTHADGLFYGGAAPVASRLIWEQIVRSYAQHRQTAFLLDLHTGLGTRGAGELISYLPEQAPDFQRMARWFDQRLKSMQGGSVSAPVAGTLTEGFDRLVHGQSYAVGLEFGTCAALKVLNALRFDQWAHNNAARLTETQREQARQAMRQAFADWEEDWYRSIIGRFDEVVDQLSRALQTTAAPSP